MLPLKTRSILKACMPPVLAAAILVACDRNNEPMGPGALPPSEPQLDVANEAGQTEPGPTFGVINPPVPLDVDITQLVPATVELATPAVCGVITVYDQEDLVALCGPTALAATPIVSPNCPQFVSGSVRLEVDLLCTNTDGLVVISDNTVIDLNGHRIVCRDPVGYFGSCQGPGAFADDDDGIDTNNHDNVHIFSHVPGGTIDGFDRGILVLPNSDNVKVKQLIVTGPRGAPGFRRPAFVTGISIFGVDCDGGNVRIGGGTKTGNDVSHHLRGIQTVGSSCVYIGYNSVHDNQKNILVPFFGSFCHAIALFDSPNNHVRSNLVTNNCDEFFIEGGPALINPGTTSTLVVENQANRNLGNGIETVQGASGNYIVNNQMLNNTDTDAFSDQSGPNEWNDNNRCITQTTPQPPLGVCSPDDVPPPQ